MFQDIALVDADSIYFRIACVHKKPNDIRKGINYTVNEIKRNTGTDKLLFAVKGTGNFRQDIYPAYKANRKELDPDLKKALNYGHQYMVDYHGAIKADGMEADDLVSIWAGEQRDYGFDPVVVGIDKDLLQIPGWHYNFVKKTEPYYVDADEANYKLMIQCLTGDSADNIPGIKGIGPKKAEKILHKTPTRRRWARVRAAWRAHGAVGLDMSYRLLKMLDSWEEFDAITNTKGETPISEQDVLEREESEDQGVSGLPDGDQG